MPELMSTSSLPLVSVVIPLYNSEKWIKQTLLSVYQQTYENIEIIVINDGSTDKSIDIVKEVSKEQTRECLELFSIENSGVSFARNLGVEKSRGDLVAFLDSDDLWVPDKLSIQYAYLESHPNFVGVTSDFYISKLDSSHDRLINTRIISKRGVRNITKSWLSLEGNGAALGSTALLWKMHFKGLISFNVNLHYAADLDFYYRLSGVGNIGHVSYPLVQYRQHDLQMHTNPELLKEDFLRLTSEIRCFPTGLSRAKVLGNVYLMSSLLNLSSGKYRKAFIDLKIGFCLRPTSIFRIPISIIYKRVKSTIAFAIAYKR
jgi:glycosyltransferase involved in cell wall biosynthesis